MKSHKIFLVGWIIFILLFSSCMPEKEEVEEAVLAQTLLLNGVAEQSVTEPYIQTIMIGYHGTQGFSWRNPGYVIKEITY